MPLGLHFGNKPRSRASASLHADWADKSPPRSTGLGSGPDDSFSGPYSNPSSPTSSSSPYTFEDSGAKLSPSARSSSLRFSVVDIAPPVLPHLSSVSGGANNSSIIGTVDMASSANNSRSSRIAKPKMMMMGLGNKINRRSSGPETDVVPTIPSMTPHDRFVDPAGLNLDLDFTSFQEESAANSIQPSPVLATGEGFHNSSNSSYSSMAEPATPWPENRSSFTPANDDEHLGLELARHYINQGPESPPESPKLSTAPLGIIPKYSDPSPVSRVKNLFGMSYSPVDQGPPNTIDYHDQLVVEENRPATVSLLAENPPKSPPPLPPKKSLNSPVRVQKLRGRSSMTFSKQLVFSREEISQLPGTTSNSLVPASFSSSSAASPNNKRVSQAEDESDLENDTLLPFSTTVMPPPPPPPPPEEYIHGGAHPRSLLLPNSSNKVMTRSQFDNYRKSVIGLGSSMDDDATTNDGTNSHGSDEDDDDDDDDDELTKNLRDKFGEDSEKMNTMRMRLKQDAHLSVYRQKMTKVAASHSNGGLSSYVRPQSMVMGNNFGGGVTPGLSGIDDDSDDDEYDDVPLGILKAHGFPSSSNRLKPTMSQPNLTMAAEEPGPNVLYQRHNTAPVGDTASIRSSFSGGVQQQQQVPKDSDLRGRPPLPNVFANPTQVMSRGLVGEIAREEEARIKRRSFGNLLMTQRASTMMESSASSNYDGSIYNGNPGTQGNSAEIHQQLQQMMQMQMQMLHQMQAPPQQNLRKHMSSFDVSQIHRQSMARPYSPRPASIRSVAMSERSLDMSRYPVKQTMSMMIPNRTSPPQLSSRPMSTLHLVSTADDDDDDEEEDDKGWKEMLEKRRGLKEMWKQQGAVAIVS
jgi:hypothetical protein